MKFPIAAMTAQGYTQTECAEIVRRSNAFGELLAFVQDSRFYDSYWRDKRKALLKKYGEPND